jgi:ComEC/Rec2-related protein
MADRDHLRTLEFALISGAQAPAVRAAIVATAAIMAFRVGRRPDFPTLILLAAGAMAIIEPAQVERLGFRLSVAASLALAWTVPALAERSRGAPLAAALGGTAAAQLATLPFLMPVFGTVSLLSVPANLVLAPLVAVAMPVAALAGVVGLIVPEFGEAIAAPAALVATVAIAIVDVFGDPAANVQVGIPPMRSAQIFAAACALLLSIMGGIGSRSRTRRAETRANLSATSPAVFAGEDPTDSLAADPDHSEEHPPREKNCHEIAEERQRGKATAGDI